MKPGRACASGPPWICTRTGRRPAKRSGGRTMKPVISRWSKLFQAIGCGVRKAAASRPSTFDSVQRVTLPAARSST